MVVPEVVPVPAVVGTVGTTRIPIPMFSERNFSMYMNEIDIWK